MREKLSKNAGKAVYARRKVIVEPVSSARSSKHAASVAFHSAGRRRSDANGHLSA